MALRAPAVGPALQDDGFIYLRIAENAARGAGPVFNHGDRVDAATSPLWLWLLAGAARLGIALPAAAAGLGVLSLFAACVLAAAWALEIGAPRRRAAVLAALVPPLAIGLDARVLLAAQSGMETAFCACIWAWAARALVRRWVQRRPERYAGWIALAAVLARPEFVAFAGALGLWTLVRRGPARRDVAPVVLPLAGGIAVWMVVHALYYGDPLPNTLRAKGIVDAAHVRLGLAYVARWPRTYPVFVLAGLAAWPRATRPLAVGLGLGVAAIAASVALLGGDHFEFHRPFVHLLPMAAALAGGVAARIVDGEAARTFGARAARLAVAASLAGLAGFAATRPIPAGAFAWVRTSADLGRVLARTYPPATRVGMFAIGAAGYTSRLPILDALGLADRHIARVRPTRAKLVPADIGHERGDPAYVLRESDVVVLFGAYAPVPFESLDEIMPAFPSHAEFLAAARREVARGAFRMRNLELAPRAYWAVLEKVP